MQIIIPKINVNDELYERLFRDRQGFEKLAGLVRAKSGINLPTNDKNQALMAGRLVAILRFHRLKEYQELYNLLRTQQSSALFTDFINALTTNTTDFFREDHHFIILRKVLPAMKKNHTSSPDKPLRVWCAAASTGQEPYTIAITLLEALGAEIAPCIKFLATDINREVLEEAIGGVYTARNIAAVPPHIRQKYFVASGPPTGSEKSFQIVKSLRSLITFAEFNLIESPYSLKYKFDIIFCRNVLIYFDQETHSRVIKNLVHQLAPGGYLFLGHCDGASAQTVGLQALSNSVWHKPRA